MSCVVVSDRLLDDDALGGRSLEAGNGMEWSSFCSLLGERERMNEVRKALLLGLIELLSC
jgi:hypothetical protein